MAIDYVVYTSGLNGLTQSLEWGIKYYNFALETSVKIQIEYWIVQFCTSENMDSVGAKKLHLGDTVCYWICQPGKDHLGRKNCFGVLCWSKSKIGQVPNFSQVQTIWNGNLTPEEQQYFLNSLESLHHELSQISKPSTWDICSFFPKIENIDYIFSEKRSSSLVGKNSSTMQRQQSTVSNKNSHRLFLLLGSSISIILFIIVGVIVLFPIQKITNPTIPDIKQNQIDKPQNTNASIVDEDKTKSENTTDKITLDSPKVEPAKDNIVETKIEEIQKDKDSNEVVLKDRNEDIPKTSSEAEPMQIEIEVSPLEMMIEDIATGETPSVKLKIRLTSPQTKENIPIKVSLDSECLQLSSQEININSENRTELILTFQDKIEFWTSHECDKNLIIPSNLTFSQNDKKIPLFKINSKISAQHAKIRKFASIVLIENNNTIEKGLLVKLLKFASSFKEDDFLSKRNDLIKKYNNYMKYSTDDHLQEKWLNFELLCHLYVASNKKTKDDYLTELVKFLYSNKSLQSEIKQSKNEKILLRIEDVWKNVDKNSLQKGVNISNLLGTGMEDIKKGHGEINKE